MKRTILFLTLIVGGANSAIAQSGLIAGPFIGGSGTYNTVLGGTFEDADPTSGWRDHNNWASLTIVSSPAMRGDRVGRVSAPSGNYAVHQFFPNLMVQGQSYVLSGFFRADDLGGSIAMDIGNFGGQAWYPVANSALEINSATVGKWYFGYVTFVADNPSMSLRLIRNGSSSIHVAQQNFFDDVAITHVDQFRAPTAVPEPATLVTLSLGALLIRRRRR